MTDYSKMDEIPINSIDTLVSDSGNQFDQLCSCAGGAVANSDTCILGLFFPCCLFGRTYERARFGSFLSGCCKYFSLQLILSIVIISSDIDNRWGKIYGPEIQFSESITDCNTFPECKPYFNGTKVIDSLDQNILANNNCNVPKYLHVCKCLNNELPNQCQFIENMPETIKDTIVASIVINTIGSLISITTLGCLLGYYRKKISDTFGIQSLPSESFFYHCIPCLNKCALCQEANTVDRLNFNNITIIPITM